MPVIRQYNRQTEARGSIPGRMATGEDFGAGVGEAVQQFGHTLMRVTEQVEQGRRQTVLATKNAQAAQELQEYSFTLQNGTIDAETGVIVAPPDPTEHLNLYSAKAKEIRDRVKGELNDDSLYGLFEADFGKVELKQSFEVRKNVIEKQKTMALGEFNVYEDTMAEVAANGDPFVQQQAVEQYRVSLRRLEAIGVIDAPERVKREKAFGSRMAEESVREAIRKDPAGAMDALLSGSFSGLDPVATQKWIDIAANNHEKQLRAQLAAEDRAYRDSERAEKDVQEGTYRDAIDMAEQGNLTVSWIRANRENISKSDYDSLMRMAAKGGTLASSDSTGNPAIYADLRIRAGNGEDVRAEAKEALNAGDIKPGQFSAITSKVESGSADAKKDRWYKNGEQFISRALAPSQINPGIDREVQARALDDWQRFASENPDATPEQQERVRDHIVNSSRIVQSQDVLTSIPKPMFLSGDKQNPNIAQTIKRTKEAYEKGEITKWEYDREGRNIMALDRWAKLQAAKPKGDKKGAN